MAAMIIVRMIQKAYLLNFKNSAIISGTTMNIRLYLFVINKKNSSNKGLRKWFINSKKLISTSEVYYMRFFVSTDSFSIFILFCDY